MITAYVVKWYVPQLGDWVRVGEYGTLDRAQGAMDRFVITLRRNWTGEPQVAIVEVAERQIETTITSQT